MSNNDPRRIKGYDPETGAPIYSNPSRGGNKAVKALLIALIVAAFGAAGWFAYDTFSESNDVDLAANMSEIKVYGYSGEGVLDDGGGLYYDGPEKGKGDIRAFYDSITYVVDKTGNLSNGEIIKVTANYDKAAAKKCKIHVTNDTLSFEVSGLRERFEADLSDMTSGQREAIREALENGVEKYAAGRAWTDLKIEGLEKSVFISRASITGSGQESYYNDTLVSVCKCSYKDVSGAEKTSYIVVEIYPLEKSFDYENGITELIENNNLIVYVHGAEGDPDDVINDIKDKCEDGDTVTGIDF